MSFQRHNQHSSLAELSSRKADDVQIYLAGALRIRFPGLSQLGKDSNGNMLALMNFWLTPSFQMQSSGTFLRISRIQTNGDTRDNH